MSAHAVNTTACQLMIKFLANAQPSTSVTGSDERDAPTASKMKGEAHR